MTLQQLLYFQAVAQTQHYRLAAEKLNITQPTLSHAIMVLEEELGLYLFEKQGRNVILTKAGNIFLEHVNLVLSDVKIMEKKMKQLVSASEGHIDIGYVSPLAKSYIPKLVHNFLSYEENRHITFSLKQNFTSRLIEGLKSNQFDVIFCSHPNNVPDLTFIPIIEQEMVAIVPWGHPLAAKDSIGIKEFNNYPVIAYDSDSGLGKFTRKTFASNDVHPQIFCESSDEYSITSLVEEGFGIALTARCHAIEQAGVAILHIEDLKLSHTVYMIYNQNRYLIPSVKSFLKFAQKMPPVV